jgi:hypothetical protein
MDVAVGGDMRVLEARFHPATKSRQGFVVVARVYGDRDRTSVQPAELSADAVHPFRLDRLQEKVEEMVAAVVGDHARSLLGLRSGYWSFVEAPNDGEPRGAG